jgi:hypothetical protein
VAVGGPYGCQRCWMEKVGSEREGRRRGIDKKRREGLAIYLVEQVEFASAESMKHKYKGRKGDQIKREG